MSESPSAAPAEPRTLVPVTRDEAVGMAAEVLAAVARRRERERAEQDNQDNR